MRKTLPWLILCHYLLWPTTTYAHKVKLFATATNNTITGYAYFPGGGRVINTPIKIQTPDGHLLGEILTNAQGEFNYTATQKIAHTFILNTGDGHQASYTLTAEELRDNLPLSGTTNLPTTQTIPTTTALPQSPPPEITHSPQELTALIETAINKQIRPLREQLEAYQEKIYLHDILGGIGYIFGMMGLMFYLGTRKS